MKKIRIPAIAAIVVLFAPCVQGQSDADTDEYEVVVEYAAGIKNNGNIRNETDTAVSREDAANAESINNASENQTAPVINFDGVLLEKGTRAPVPDTEIYIKDISISATTDASGAFAFTDIPVGIVEVVIPTTQFETFSTSEKIAAGEKTTVKYYLVPRTGSAMEVVVRDKKAEKEVSRSVIQIQEAELVPGTGGDALKAIESMPGVARGMGGGDIVIRGSNAEDSKFYIDGHEIYSVFHFGGLKSTYNSKLIDSFELMTGGFSAKHGLATGGIVNVETRAPRNDRFGGYVDLSMIDGSFLVEGPISNKMEVAFAARRSTTDLLLSAMNMNEKIDGLNFTTYPMYWDYQAKWNYRINKHHTLGLDVYGDKDGMAMNLDMVDDSDPNLTGVLDFSFTGHNIFLHHRYKNGNISNHFSPGVYLMKENNEIGEYYFKGSYTLFDIKDDLEIRLSKSHTLGMGLGVTSALAALDANMVQPPKEGDVGFTFSNSEVIRTESTVEDVISSAYIQDEMQFKKLTLIPSLRFDHEAKMNIIGVGPRLGARYQIVPPFTVKASGGLYHRVPDYDEYDDHFGNDGLTMERAVHSVAGFEWALTDVIDLDIQGYYKYLDQLVTSRTDSNGEQYYDNSAKGYVFGGELLLRHNWTDRFFGWVSYSLSKSMRTDGPGTEYRPFDMDQRHNLIAVASWQFAKGWRLGLRFQYTSGEPYTKVNNRIFNGDNGTYFPVYDDEHKNEASRSAYHRLDLRVDKEWLFNTWVLHTYLDIQNVYMHRNEVDTVYNYDFSENIQITDLPILPSIGVTAEF